MSTTFLGAIVVVLVGGFSLPVGTELQQPAQAPPPAQAPARAAAPAAKTHRWVDIQLAQLDARYRYMDSDAGVTTANQMQNREQFRVGLKFDKAGRYSLQTMAGSGTTFQASWDNSGPGTGDTSEHLYVRQLFLSAAPIAGVEVQLGGIAPVRGESSEITHYDNDGYMVGERITVRRRQLTQLDEIAFTAGHIGDLETPNVFRRFDGISHHNFAQILTSRRFGVRASASLDWTTADHEDTFHEAIRISIKESGIVDGVRLEFYERVTGVTGKGFAVSVDRVLTKALSVAGGYATVDRFMALNADRFMRGRRVFVEGRYALTPEITLSAFYTRAFHNDFAMNNRTRFDLVFSYNVLRGLQRVGIW